MSKKIMDQVHIIPFDIGMVFYDEVSLDNTKNIELAEIFVDELSKYCSHNNFEYKKLFKSITIGRKKKDYNFESYSYARHCLFQATLSSQLRFFLISSGVGVFVLNDINGEFLPDEAINTYNKEQVNEVILARYQKEYVQEHILNSDDKSKLDNINKIMAEFKSSCWGIIEKTTKELKISLLRPYSSCDSYKYHGFSYVLTMYIANKNDTSEKELNYLLYASVLKANLDSKKWKQIGDISNSNESYDVVSVKEGENSSAYFSWSAVAIYVDRDYKIEELVELDVFKNMLKAEIYVQTRWFVGDNTLDNVRGKYYNLEKIERLIGLLDLTMSELKNETSANMSTFYKKICKCIIETSGINTLYSSASSQLNIQRNIKKAQYEKIKNKNRLILNIILSVFTAVSLAKTIKEFLDGDHSVRNWIIFGITICIAVGIILVNYAIDNKK